MSNSTQGPCSYVVTRRFDIEGNLLHETDPLGFPYGGMGGEACVAKPPRIHDMCNTDLVQDGLTLSVAGSQQHNDLYIFAT